MTFLEKIKAIPITEYAEYCGFTLVKKGSRYVSLKEHDSVIIDTDKNCFWRNSVYQRGDKRGAGSVIDFAMEFMSFTEPKKAMRELALIYGISGDSEEVSFLKKERSVSSAKHTDVIELPPASDNAKKVYAYLSQKRKIDISVIRYFLSNELLYQEKKYGNCVFVSENKKFACMRSTADKKFVGDVIGSDYNECFFFRPSEKSTSLIVAESVIDIMSIMTIFYQNKKRYTEYSYLALAGTNKLHSLYYHLEKEKDIKTVILAFDNDEAGEKAKASAISELSKYNVEIKIYNPASEKDWNEYLQRRANENTEKI